MLKTRIKSVFNPENYHGWGNSKKFFEGWYYKLINEDETKAFAIIPGIAMDENGVQQSFIQILDGKNSTAEYYKFGAHEFIPNPNKFEIKIAHNYFSSDNININLKNFKADLSFSNQIPWPKKFLSPGVMGPYSFIPFMECYHGILSMNHDISGQITVNNEIINFNKGRGYIEKDWGHSFPSAYFWLQTNHFSKHGISLKASVAKIPWLGKSFIGFISGIWFENKLIEFTTYNSTKLVKSFADKNTVEIIFQNKNYRLEIFAHRNESTELASPISGFMDGKIEESMTSKIDVKLSDLKNNKVLLEDTGRNAALEVAGKIEEIIKI